MMKIQVLIIFLEKVVCGRSLKSASYAKHVGMDEHYTEYVQAVSTRTDLAKGVPPNL